MSPTVDSRPESTLLQWHDVFTSQGLLGSGAIKFKAQHGDAWWQKKDPTVWKLCMFGMGYRNEIREAMGT
jgi:hypothetical protein